MRTIAVAVMALALSALMPSDPLLADTCDSQYQDCKTQATTDRNACNDNCDITYPPGPDHTSCINGCTTVYNSQNNACSSAKSNCLNARQGHCDNVDCPATCGSNNPATYCTYFDDAPNGHCDVVCECTGTRPNCPGS